MKSSNSGLATILVIVTLLVALLSEAFVAQPTYKGVTHVTYWEKWTNFERDAMKVVVDKYNATEGAKKHIFVDFMPVSGIEDKTMIATSGGVPPDVSGLTTVDVAAFADNGALLPLDKYCDQYGIKESDYIPVEWKQLFYHNHVYALATTPATNALHYNKTEFKDAGLDPNHPPETLNEMDAMADKLSKKDSSGTWTQLGFIPADPGWWNYSWGYYFGGSLWDGTSKITCNSPENIRAFDWIASYSKKYEPTAVASFKSSFLFDSGTNGFISGKEAMQLQGVWMYNFINKYDPKLDWAAAPFPHPDDRPDLAFTTVADSDNLVIPVGAKHPAEAFDFIAFVQRQENMELLCMGQKKFSPLAKVSDEFMKNHPNPYIKLFSDLARSKNARCAPMMGIFSEYNNDLGEAFEEVTLLKKTPKEALDDVQKRDQDKLDHYLMIEKIREKQQ
jgi:ABC-type glycerol-3-phosphate transport system substrate-binding protein